MKNQTNTKKENWHIVIFNYESGQIDCLDLCNMPEDMDAKEYTETILDYSLSNCEWITVAQKPHINFLN
jgi:hypothetical protein